MPLITKARRSKAWEPGKLEQVSSRYGVRWRIRKGSTASNCFLDHTAVVVEDPPRKVPIALYSDLSRKEYVIGKPWSYVIAHITESGGFLKSSIFFSYQRLRSTSQRSLLLVPLPNVAYTRRITSPGICLGAFPNGGPDLDGKAVWITEKFWGSQFNTELPVEPCAKPRWGRDKSEVILERWHDKTEKGHRFSFQRAPSKMSSIASAVDWLTNYF